MNVASLQALHVKSMSNYWTSQEFKGDAPYFTTIVIVPVDGASQASSKLFVANGI